MVLITSAVKDVLGCSMRTWSVLRKVEAKVMFKGNQIAQDGWKSNQMTATGRELNWLSKKLENNLLLKRNKECTHLPKSLFPE